MIDSAFFWLAISAGAFALLTPCVFPMVPITASYFAKHGGGDRKAAVRNALLFGAGIVGTFTAAGLATSVLVGAAGMARFAAHPWVNLAIAAMFVAFALNFFGLYEIRLPAGLLARLDRVTRDRASSGALGAVLVGGTFAVTPPSPARRPSSARCSCWLPRGSGSSPSLASWSFRQPSPFPSSFSPWSRAP